MQAQLESVAIFLNGQRTQTMFLEAGGIELLLDILKHEIETGNVKVQVACFTLLQQILSLGRKCRELICLNDGLHKLMHTVWHIEHPLALAVR